MKKIVIAIDGYSSGGKSTFAKAIASRLGYIFIDTGAMYRAVTLFALRSGMIRNGEVDRKALVEALGRIRIGFRYNPEKGKSDIYLDGENVEDEIRGIEVSTWVSHVSSIAEVRALLVRLQQQMGKDKGIVMDGRDIGTAVLPDAQLKIYLTASSHVRAVRRYEELKAKGVDSDLSVIEADIIARDQRDMTREISPLCRAEDAELIDSSEMTIEEVVEKIESFCRESR